METKNADRLKITKKTESYKTISVRISGNLADRIESIAEETGRNRNDVIAHLLDWSADRCDVVD